jgi:transcriptional regulator with XRE-family HTH domain
MAEFEVLYRKLGRKIRDARERSELSQEKLAERLSISRASIVNVEAGRQRPPLHVLWKIAEALGTELVLLIPRRDELAVSANPVRLDRATIKQIEDAANGDPNAMKELTGLVSKLKTTINAKKPDKETS